MDDQTLDLARWQFGLTAAPFVTVVFGGLPLESPATPQPMKPAVCRRGAEELARLQAELTARFGPGGHLPNEALTRGAGPLRMPAFALLMHGVPAAVVLARFRRAVYRARPWHLVLMARVPLPFRRRCRCWQGPGCRRARTPRGARRRGCWCPC
ncbi:MULTISPECIES: hypothetical protein [Streptomyces]|uniref:hypothetical protein n=1 Tax=Streptomyces TaxID=1883 RepID=UPI001906C28B|nr:MULTISPECIES: hypothetical protein [unclassified Streptomyces]MCU4747510.1 hypothetical protein [Streptomyces sp. G-5]QQN78129.1 hypothetical protein IPZ77_12220 [Streptomyces sp. XC 2026]